MAIEQFNKREVLTAAKMNTVRDAVNQATTDISELKLNSATKTELAAVTTGTFYGYAASSSALPTVTANGYAYVGTAAPYAIWNYTTTGGWADSGATVDTATGEATQNASTNLMTLKINGATVTENIATPEYVQSELDEIETKLSNIDEYPSIDSSNLIDSNAVAIHGSAFDITEYHKLDDTSTYTDLSNALGTDGANIPENARHGGMTVKFVQSSDSKYVSYRLLSDSFNTTTSNWVSLNVDDMPTVDSENLVKSGGVYNELTNLSSQTPNIINGWRAFSIVDENGNEVARLNGYLKIGADGTLETAGFNSATEKGRTTALENAVSAITPHPVSVESSDDVLNVADENGNRAVVVNKSVEVQGKVKVFSGGRVKTDSFDSDNVAFTINGMQTELARFPRTVFPQINYAKSTFRWLDIGNSHSHCSLAYLNYIAKSQGVDLSNVAFCRVSRGGSAFKDWVNGWNNEDTSEEGDLLTGGMYGAVKDFGGLSVKVTGNTYTEVNGTPTPVVDHELSQSSTQFWGGDCSILRSLLRDNEWDLITIHQRYVYNEKYDESDGWVNDLESGTYTKSGDIKEFVRILKSTNPQATVGFLFALTPFGFNGESVVYDEATSLNNTLDAHERWCDTVKKFMKDSGVDLAIPCNTALQNLRISSVPNVANEWDESETPTILDIYDRWGFNFDSAHTAAAGVAPYTMSAVAWEMVFAPRFGVSIMKNRLHELKANDLGDGTTSKYLQPSYDDNGVDTIIDDRDTNPWNKPLWVDWNTRELADTRATATVRLTDSNRPACQMAAMLAVSDMWEVNNPDNLTI